MTMFLDPRIRMRDALRELIDENPGGWEQPSLFVLRNRLLDRTGSDARPLAELLLEALGRGWRERLPTGRLGTPQFDGLAAPFVMQWSAQRFVQPEMARWAVESWAYALGRIDAQQIRIAPPPKRESMTAMASRLNAQATVAGVQTADTARAIATATAIASARSSGNAKPRPPVAVPARPRGARNTARPTPSPSSRFTAPYTPRSRPLGPSIPAWIPRAMFGTLVAMGLAVVIRVAVANGRNAPTRVASATSPEPARAAGSASAAETPVDQAATETPLVSTANIPGEPVIAAPTMPATSAPAAASAPVPAAPGASPAGQVVSPSLTGGVTIVATERPGVPSITRGLLSTGADTARMMFVQPARRAAGESRRIPTAPTSARPITYDELRLEDGTVLRGRVEVVRSGTVIFRDMRSGLRIEYRKDDIDELITEFGTRMRFSPARATAVGTSAATAKKPVDNGVRSKGVAGRYRVRYAAASAVGSPECTQVWTRAPNSEDVAEVRHLPGADTLSIAFQGGDVFPSNVDREGYFASTFRIVPDQARTMTALTTRLNGRFTADGALSLTVNIVFYRRLRTGEVTCNVTVQADGTRT